MWTGKISRKDLYNNCNGNGGDQTFSLPTCCICLQNLLPLFPVDTMLNVDNATLSFKDIYSALTNINLDKGIHASQETCLSCFRSIINAFLVVKQDSDMSLKDCHGKEIKGISRCKTQPKVSFKREYEDIIPGVENCDVSTKESKMLSTKEILEKRTQKPQMAEGNKTQTIFRCRYCHKLFFDHEIKAHARTCPDPVSKLNKKSNPVKNGNAIFNDKSTGIANSSTSLNGYINEQEKPKTISDYSRSSKTSAAKASESDSGNKGTTNDLLLQCKLCKSKLYMSQMEEHKTHCRPKLIKNTNEAAMILNTEKILKNSKLSQKRKLPDQRNSYKCQLCNKRCMTEDLLMTHIMKHTSEQHQCKICPMKFNERELLSKHERKHYTSNAGIPLDGQIVGDKLASENYVADNFVTRKQNQNTISIERTI